MHAAWANELWARSDRIGRLGVTWQLKLSDIGTRSRHGVIKELFRHSVSVACTELLANGARIQNYEIRRPPWKPPIHLREIVIQKPTNPCESVVVEGIALVSHEYMHPLESLMGRYEHSLPILFGSVVQKRLGENMACARGKERPVRSVETRSQIGFLCCCPEDHWGDAKLLDQRRLPLRAICGSES